MHTPENLKFPNEYFGNITDELYLSQVEVGQRIAKNKNILFCATCKDVAKTIKRMLDIVDYTGSLFKSYDIFLYENNSSDGTPDIIRSINNPRVILQSEHIENASYERNGVSLSRRCNLISAARNKYVQFINDNAGKYDYIFVFDADIVGGWSYEGVLSSLSFIEHSPEIAAMTSYCVIASSDCKDLEEVNKDYWIMFDSFAFRRFEDDKPDYMEFSNIKYSINDPVVIVGSNFNGLAIYKPECFIDNFYPMNNDVPDELAVCEHVGFHRNIYKKTGKYIVLNPAMITSISKHKYCK